MAAAGRDCAESFETVGLRLPLLWLGTATLSMTDESVKSGVLAEKLDDG